MIKSKVIFLNYVLKVCTRIRSSAPAHATIHICLRSQRGILQALSKYYERNFCVSNCVYLNLDFHFSYIRCNTPLNAIQQLSPFLFIYPIYKHTKYLVPIRKKGHQPYLDILSQSLHRRRVSYLFEEHFCIVDCSLPFTLLFCASGSPSMGYVCFGISHNKNQIRNHAAYIFI